MFAIIRRALKGENISKADKFHIHHQLLNRNFSPTTTVLIIYVIDLLFAAASVIYITKYRDIGYILYGILLIIVILFVAKTNVIMDDDQKKKLFHKKQKSS